MPQTSRYADALPVPIEFEMKLSAPRHATCLSPARSGHTLEVPERIPKAALGRPGAGRAAEGETEEEPSAQQACGVSFPF